MDMLIYLHITVYVFRIHTRNCVYVHILFTELYRVI